MRGIAVSQGQSQYQLYSDFMDNGWTDDGKGTIKRAHWQNSTFEIVDVGNGFFQPIVQVYSLDKVPVYLNSCRSLEAAKDAAWNYYQQREAGTP
jgi:hypothetical protein